MKRRYGNSAIFVRTAAYHALGGLRPIPPMEDCVCAGALLVHRLGAPPRPLARACPDRRGDDPG